MALLTAVPAAVAGSPPGNEEVLYWMKNLMLTLEQTKPEGVEDPGQVVEVALVISVLVMLALGIFNVSRTTAS